MNLVTFSENRTVRIAAIVIAASLIAGSTAIFVFKVAPSTVLSIALFGLFIANHLFMHGGHGSHSGHGENDDHTQHALSANQTTSAVAKTDQKNTEQGHSCCH